MPGGTSTQSDPGNLISPDPRRAPTNPLSPRASPEKAKPTGVIPSKPVLIPSQVKDDPAATAVEVTATAGVPSPGPQGAALPLVGSPDQYLLRAKDLPPKPGMFCLHLLSNP